MIFKSTKQDLNYTLINVIEMNKVSRGYARRKMLLPQLKFVVKQRIISYSSNIFPPVKSGPRFIKPCLDYLVSGGEKQKNPISDESEMGLKKKGNDLLSHKCSTIGANGLNFSVRNGKRWFPIAVVT